jgi:phasin family protein
MVESMQKTVDDFQKMGKDNYDAMVRSYGELNKGLQAIAARWAGFSKRSFEEATSAWEQMISAKSLERAMEVQSNYAKNAYDNWMTEMSKIGEMYSSTARDAYKPIEKTTEKHHS